LIYAAKVNIFSIFFDNSFALPTLQDFLDGVEAMMRKGNETVTLQEFNNYIDNRIQSHV
jgi:hypothetical protein